MIIILCIRHHRSAPSGYKLGKLRAVCRRSSTCSKTEIRYWTSDVSISPEHAFRDRVTGIVSGCADGGGGDGGRSGERRADGIQIRERK